MKYNFDEIRDRSNAAKWGIASQIGAIGMGVADMDFGLIPEVAEAIKECADKGEFGYTGMTPTDYEAIIGWLEFRGYNVPIEYIVPTPGVLYSARTAMYMLTQPGDRVIVQTPLHTPSIATAEMQGRIPTINRLKYSNGKYEIDFEDLENCFRMGAKVLMMCAPNNPTGRVWTKDELDKIADLVVKYDAYVISDEIHRDIVWDGHKHISPTSIEKIKDRSIAVFSTSKTFNMGGFHIGSAIIPNPDLRERFRKYFYTLGHTCDRPSTLCMAAQTAAYTHGKEWYKQMMSYLGANIDLALDQLDGLPIHARRPEGTFLLWIDVSDMNMQSLQMRDVMRNEWKVLCDRGVLYDTPHYKDINPPEHHIRMNLATPRSNVEEALCRIRKYFGK